MTHDPDLTPIEGKLFELMRDLAITSIVAFAHNHPPSWRCTVELSDGTPLLFNSKVSALDAYMQAYNDILTRKLEGEPIYTREGAAVRKKLGLEA